MYMLLLLLSKTINNYILLVQVFMVGKDPAGLIHSVQSLLSMEDGTGEVPDVVTVDYPRFHYRG